jgi:hypothetical protein
LIMGLSEDGFTLARIARALAISRGDVSQARAYCEAQHGMMALASRVLQKGVLDTGVLGDDVDAGVASQAFITLARRGSLIEAINAASPFARVPFALPFLVEGAGAVAFWTKEGEAIRTSSETFTSMRLSPLKLASLVVLTVELLRLIGAAGDAAINRALQRAANTTEAQAFIDPANAGIDGEEPASITHGAATTAATGDTAADIRALTSSFEGDLASSVWLIGPALAVSFALAGAAIGAADIGMGQVGYLAGLPIVVHSAVPADALVLLDPAMIAMTERVFVVDASTEASVEVTDDDDDSKTTLVSLWQLNMASMRLRQYINWSAPAGSVSLLTGIGAAKT